MLHRVCYCRFVLSVSRTADLCTVGRGHARIWGLAERRTLDGTGSSHRQYTRPHHRQHTPPSQAVHAPITCRTHNLQQQEAHQHSSRRPNCKERGHQVATKISILLLIIESKVTCSLGHLRSCESWNRGCLSLAGFTTMDSESELGSGGDVLG